MEKIVFLWIILLICVIGIVYFVGYHFGVRFGKGLPIHSDCPTGLDNEPEGTEFVLRGFGERNGLQLFLFLAKVEFLEGQLVETGSPRCYVVHNRDIIGEIKNGNSYSLEKNEKGVSILVKINIIE